MSTKWLVVLGLGTLLLGLAIGYVMWGTSAQNLATDLADVKARLAEQTQRADAMQSKVGDLEPELARLRDKWKEEQELRRRLEEQLSKGRK